MQHRLLFDDGQEIDLSKSSLIATAKPNLNNLGRQAHQKQRYLPQIRTPSKTRYSNAFQNKTLQVASPFHQTNKNSSMSFASKTPGPAARAEKVADKAGMIERSESVDDGYPLQRVFNLQVLHSNEASRFRVRHASAHFESKTSAVERQI